MRFHIECMDGRERMQCISVNTRRRAHHIASALRLDRHANSYRCISTTTDARQELVDVIPRRSQRKFIEFGVTQLLNLLGRAVYVAPRIGGPRHHPLGFS